MFVFEVEVMGVKMEATCAFEAGEPGTLDSKGTSAAFILEELTFKDLTMDHFDLHETVISRIESLAMKEAVKRIQDL